MCLSVFLCTYRIACPGICMCVSPAPCLCIYKQVFLHVCGSTLRRWIYQYVCFFVYAMGVYSYVRLFACVCAQVSTRVRYEQSVSFPAAEPTNHIPPSSLFITYSWVSVSAGRWLALNEQLTALSVSQCYGNKISQSVQKKHQSTTGTGTLFNWSSETVYPSGRLTYWILSTAWYLWYDSHNVSNPLVIKCTHFKMLWIITAEKKSAKAFSTCGIFHLVFV